MIEEAWSEAIIAWASEIEEIAAVYVFGSYARGEQRPESDLDLAVVIDTGLEGDHNQVVWSFKNRDWLAKLQPGIPVEIDFELGNPEIVTEIVGPAVRVEGALVYGREGWSE